MIIHKCGCFRTTPPETNHWRNFIGERDGIKPPVCGVCQCVTEYVVEPWSARLGVAMCLAVSPVSAVLVGAQLFVPVTKCWRCAAKSAAWEDAKAGFPAKVIPGEGLWLEPDEEAEYGKIYARCYQEAINTILDQQASARSTNKKV